MTTPAWARDFNNERRHCWDGPNGRWLDSQESFDTDRLCTDEHDPKLTGQVEWLRFVHEFGTAAKAAAIANPFAPDLSTPEEGIFHLLSEQGQATSDGRITFTEAYLREKGSNWGMEPVFRVFLANADGWARIECYDHELVGLCEQALGAVERSYGQAVTR